MTHLSVWWSDGRAARQAHFQFHVDELGWKKSQHNSFCKMHGLILYYCPLSDSDFLAHSVVASVFLASCLSPYFPTEVSLSSPCLSSYLSLVSICDLSDRFGLWFRRWEAGFYFTGFCLFPSGPGSALTVAMWSECRLNLHVVASDHHAEGFCLDALRP